MRIVLKELGQKIKEIVLSLSNNTLEVNDAFVNQIMNDISITLLKADVNAKIVLELRENIKLNFKLHANELITLRKFIQKCIIEELTQIFQSNIESYKPKKGQTNIIMFMGLQGSGKTSTCFKYAYYYQKRGWKVAIVCADKSSFDQTKQNAIKLRVPYYGSYTESDQIQIAYDGVLIFKKEGVELILVDTSGRYEEEKVLFEEIKQVENIIQPDNTIFIVNSSFGQSCYDKALAFKNAFSIGSVIITKLDDHLKGGGAISAVVASKSSINFICYGEHVCDFIDCQSSSFIIKLLGFSDMKKLIKKLKGFVSIGPKEIQFTLRDLESQLKSILKNNSVFQLLSIIPGINASEISNQNENKQIQRIKNYLYILNSMTSKELDGQVHLNYSRIVRIAKGSGSKIEDVNCLLQTHKTFQKVNHPPIIYQCNDQKKTTIQQNIFKLIQKDPKTLQQFGGIQTLQNMMKQIGKVENNNFNPNQ